MPYKKKSHYPRRRRTFSRYKKKRTAGAKFGRRMQRMALSFVKKKYTTVQPIRVLAGQNISETTISHIGGRNAAVPAGCFTLASANPDGMAQSDMNLYQFFRITGVAFKMFWPEGTDPGSTPVQWSMGYSSNQVIKPSVTFDRLQTLQTYQTSSCSAKTPVSRYFRTAQSLKRLGVDWCDTTQFPTFGSTPPAPLYGGQLPVNAGSSTNLKVYRSSATSAMENAAELGRLQVTYYVTYKGAKGTGSLIT